MFRFSLAQFLMVQCLLGILLALYMSEGCGDRYHAIRGLAFSPDGQRLAVARHDAHDAHVPLKGYLADVSRTVSVLRVPTLDLERVLQRDRRSGNQGPAFHSFGVPARLVAFADNDSLFVASLPDQEDDVPLTLYEVQSGNSMDLVWKKRMGGRPLAIGVSPNLQWLAATDGASLEFLPLQKGFDSKFIYPVGTTPDIFDMSLEWSPSSERVALACGRRALLQPLEGPSMWLNLGDFDPGDTSGVAFSAADEPILSTFDRIWLYDVAGGNVTTLWPAKGTQLASQAGRVAFCETDTPARMTIVDIATRKETQSLPLRARPTCVEFSPDGKLLAAGTAAGEVELWDVETGKRLAWLAAPTSQRWPWIVPVGFAVVWALLWRRMHKRPTSTPAE